MGRWRANWTNRAGAVVSFEKVEAMNLTYSEASDKLADLEEQGIPGLCIVTNQAAIKLDPDNSDV